MYIVQDFTRSLFSFEAAHHIPHGWRQHMQLTHEIWSKGNTHLIWMCFFIYIIYRFYYIGLEVILHIYKQYLCWKLFIEIYGGIWALTRKILQVFQRSQMQIKDFATFSAAVIFAHLRCVKLVAGPNQWRPHGNSSYDVGQGAPHSFSWFARQAFPTA